MKKNKSTTLWLLLFALLCCFLAFVIVLLEKTTIVWYNTLAPMVCGIGIIAIIALLIIDRLSKKQLH